MDAGVSLSAEMYSAIMERANGLKGRYFDAMEICRMGVIQEGCAPPIITDERCEGFADAEPVDPINDAWAPRSGPKEALDALHTDFRRTCRRVARHMMHVDAWGQWAPELRETLARIPKDHASESATRILIKHSALFDVEVSALRARQSKARRRPPSGRLNISMCSPTET